MMNSLCV